MALVADASTVVAFLTDDGPRGEWAAVRLAGHEIAAPALLFFEVANTLRRLLKANIIGRTTASEAHADLLAMPVTVAPYELLSERAWELRENFTILDASYIALAELLDATLITLDERMARGPGIRCRMLTYGTRA